MRSLSGVRLKAKTAFHEIGPVIRNAIFAEWKFIREQKTVLSVLILIPVFYPIILSFLYYRDQAVERPAVIIDEDNSALSRRLTLALDATQEIRVVKRTHSFEEAFKDLRNRRAELIVYAPPDFSERIKRGRQGVLKLWIETANMSTYGMSYPGVYNAVYAIGEEISRRYFYSKGMTTRVANMKIMPVARDSRYLYHPTQSYGGFVIIGIFMVVMQQLVLISLAYSTGLQRELGGFDPAGPNAPFALVGKMLAHSVFQYAGAGFIIFAIFPFFGWARVAPFALFGLFIAFAAAMAPASIFVASLMRDRYASFQLLMFVSTPLFMISGFAWPFEAMPKWIQAVALLFPLTPAIQALRILSMKSANLSYIVPYLLMMLAQFAAHLLLVFAWFAWKRKKAASAPPTHDGAGEVFAAAD